MLHGYLLRGTGSNVYNASLAAALVSLGHEVHLLGVRIPARDCDPVSGVQLVRDSLGDPPLILTLNFTIQGTIPALEGRGRSQRQTPARAPAG